MASIISAGTTSGTSLNLSADTSGVLQLATNGTTTAVTIDTSQNVGIGTASPAQRLDVVTSGGNAYIRVARNAQSAGQVGLHINGGTSGTDWYLANFASSNDLSFFGNGAERMRITSTGNLGLGVTPSASDLPTMQSNYALVSGNLQTNIISNGYYTSALGFTYTSTAVATHYRQVSGAHQFFCAPSGTINTAISFTQVLNAEKDKSIALQGGTSQTGTGITFPSTQNASSDATTLDDYEEGTFTPIAYGLSSAGTTTYNSQVGSYTKIGNLVTVNFSINVASMTGTGALALGGFPFTAAVNNNGSAPVMLENLDWGGGSYVQMYMGDSRTYAIPYYMTDNSGWSAQQVNNEQFAAIFTLSYRV